MKIIDWSAKGNMVRFFYGNDDEFWGDDWGDYPYEHNAGLVYEQYISGIIDVAFPFDSVILEAEHDWRYRGNSPYSKKDFKDRKAPFLIVVPKEERNYDPVYSEYSGNEKCVRFYMNDTFDDFEEKLAKARWVYSEQVELSYNETKRQLYDCDGNEFNLYW